MDQLAFEENMKSDEKTVNHVQHRVRIAVIGKADVGKSGKNLQKYREKKIQRKPRKQRKQKKYKEN